MTCHPIVGTKQFVALAMENERLKAERAEMLGVLKRARLLLGIALNASDYADAVAAIETAIKKTEGEE